MDQTPSLKLNLPAFAFEPWDDEVNDNFDILDAFVGSVVGIHNFVGMWTNDHAYTVGEQVADSADSTFWVCNVSHTSASPPITFLNDRTDNPTHWTMQSNTARYYAGQAASSAADAAASALAAQQAFEAIMPDAPHTGDIYGRINGLWARAAPLQSPIFTGDPQAPTPPSTDNDTSIATTAFVKTLIGTTAAFVTISDVPPVSPSIGSLWWDDVGGQLYVYYFDGNSYQWVAVNSATGGQGTGFLPLIGGTLTGPLLLSRDALSSTEATTKNYVDNAINTHSYPYLPLTGGTLSGPGNLAVNGALNVVGNASTGSIFSAANAVPSGMLVGSLNATHITLTNGVCYNLYWNSLTSNWTYRGAGGGALWYFDQNNTTLTAYLVGAGSAGGTAGIAGVMTMTTGRITANTEILCTTNIWAANRYGGFGLQDFGGGFYGLRFASDGWRLQYNSATGSLTFINAGSVSLFSIDGGGNAQTYGQIVAGTVVYGSQGVRFGYQNSWEYGAYVDGAGNQIFAHRAGWYEYWNTSGGGSTWVKNNAVVMSLDGGGSLAVSGNFSAAGQVNVSGGITAGYLRSTLDANIDRNLAIGSTLNVGGNTITNAVFAPNGTFIGGSGDTNFGTFKSGGLYIRQFSGNWYTDWNTSTGTMQWVTNGVAHWRWTQGTDPELGSPYPNVCWNRRGPVGGSFFISAGPVAGLRVGAQTRTRRGIAEIMKINAVEFKRKREPLVQADGVVLEAEPEPLLEIGFMPEHVAQVMPEVADVSAQVGTINVCALIAVLWSGVQELSARVVALEAR